MLRSSLTEQHFKYITFNNKKETKKLVIAKK